MEASSALTITRQSSLCQEHLSKNGIQKDVHVVVKNQPFQISLAVVGTAARSLNFTGSAITLEARLVYDVEGFKEVDFVKARPMEYKVHAQEDGAQATVEARLKVLTSQLEDSLFRIRFTVMYTTARSAVPGLSVLSEPIKVVSKPEQVRPKQKTPKPAPASKKRPADVNDTLLEKLSSIEEQQEQQHQLLAALVNRLFLAPNSMQSEPKKPKKGLQAGVAQSEFEHNFEQFMAAYQSVPADEKAERIRRLTRTTGNKDLQFLIELLDLFASEGLEKHARQQSTQMPDRCECEDCPAKLELQNIDTFYDTFLSEPSFFS